MKYFIGIDNGVTGSVCVLDSNGNVIEYFPTPVQKTLNYTKAKEYITRVDGDRLGKILRAYAADCTVVIERPLVNPGRWKATVSAIRCDEATRIILEVLQMKFIYIDSREWQTPMLPKRKAVPRATKSTTPDDAKKLKTMAQQFKTETKQLSLMTAQRLFPSTTFKDDGDAALMAEWARRENL